MPRNNAQGNSRSQNGVNAEKARLAKIRAEKAGALSNAGNPRSKGRKDDFELQGFVKSNIAVIQEEPIREEKEQKVRIKKEGSRKLKKIKKQKKEPKQVREKRRVNKKRLVIVLVLLLVLASGGAVAYVTTSDVFEIQEVEYVGAEHLTQSECEALAPSPAGQNLLTFDSNKITSGFVRDAWVEKVSYNRVFPHKLQIVITERNIGAVVEFNSGANQVSQSWIVTLDGLWIMGVPAQDSDVGKTISSKIFKDVDAAVHIKDCPNGIAPEIGKQCTDETVLNALQILKEFSTDIKDNVASISVANINATTLQLKNNVEVAFGAAENVREKERIAKEIMSQNDKVVYVNVRSIDRPTWRAAS